MLKVNNKNTRERREIYSELAIKTPEPRQSFFTRIVHSVFIVKFELISHHFLLFILLVDFEYAFVLQSNLKNFGLNFSFCRNYL